MARGCRSSRATPKRLAAAEDQLETEVGDRTRVAAEPADVTKPEMFEQALGLLVAQFGPVDVLVTNAGGARPGHFEELPASVFVEQMELNYFGPLHPIRAVVPSMIERGQGHLMLVSSGAGHRRRVRVLGILAGEVRGTRTRRDAPFRAQAAQHRRGLRVPARHRHPGPRSARVRRSRAATASISATIKVRSAETVGKGIVAGIERDRLVVTFDTSTAALARIGGLLGRCVRATMDRHVRRADRSRSRAQE